MIFGLCYKLPLAKVENQYGKASQNIISTWTYYRSLETPFLYISRTIKDRKNTIKKVGYFFIRFLYFNSSLNSSFFYSIVKIIGNNISFEFVPNHSQLEWKRSESIRDYKTIKNFLKILMQEKRK